MKEAQVKNLILLLILGVVLSGLTYAQDTKTTAAVMDLEAREGFSAGMIVTLSDYLRTQLVNTNKFTIVTRENMEQVLKEQNFQLSGCTSQECLVQVGQLLGVRKMFTGTIGKVGATYIINLKIIDVQSGQIEKAETEECAKCEEDALLVSLRNISQKITGLPVSEEKKLAPEIKQTAEGIPGLRPLDAVLALGSLFVDSFPAKGKVYLNDKYVGNTPFASDNIPVGVYNLKVIAENYATFQGSIQVPVGRKENIYIKLDKNLSTRNENPCYAHCSKMGIQIRGGFDAYVSGGIVFYSPYFCGSGRIGLAFGGWAISGEGLVNIPLDWWSFQFGGSYNYISMSLYGLNLAYDFINIPVGFEFFSNQNFSWSFHGGPAFIHYRLPSYSYGSYDFWGFGINLDGRINFYF